MEFEQDSVRYHNKISYSQLHYLNINENSGIFQD